MPLVETAYELRVDGVWLAGEGRVSDRPEGAVPAYRPRIVPLPAPAAGVLNLEVRVSNWDDQFAGLCFAPTLGPWAEVQADRDRAALWEALVFGALAFTGLYHAGSFFFRSQNRAPLWFGLFCLAVALRSTLYSELIFLDAFPEAPWILVIRGVYLTMSLGVVAFAAFVDRLYPDLSWRPGLFLGVAAGLVYALINLAAPLVWTTSLLVPFQLVMVAVGVQGLVTLLRAGAQHRPGAALFLGGLAVFLVTLLVDIGKTHLFWDLPSLVNMGLLVFVLAQALVVSRLFADAFAAAEVHAEAVDKLNTSLERFIPREVLGFLNKKSITEIELGDYTQRTMTVFFLDIRDFTHLSEAMGPEENFRFINSFLRLFGPIIRSHGGFVDKYLGDGIMALFPRRPDDALAAALTMRGALLDYNAGRVRAGYPAIRFGIGVHTGLLMLGTIGENRRMDSTVISDTVNAASRLEGLTKKYGLDILLSGETMDQMEDPGAFELRFVARETVKGRSQPITVYHLP